MDWPGMARNAKNQDSKSINTIVSPLIQCARSLSKNALRADASELAARAIRDENKSWRQPANLCMCETAPFKYDSAVLKLNPCRNRKLYAKRI